MPASSSLEERYFGHEHLSVIEPLRRWRLPDWRQLWAYRELFLALGARDIRVRYKQTILGALWAILQPLVTMIIFTVIFGRFASIPSEGLPYPLFVFSGLLPWALFAAIVSGAAASVVGSSSLVTKVYFPRLLIPAATIATPSIDFLVSSLLLLLLMLYYRVGFPLQILAVPLLAMLLLLLAVGVGTLLSALTVTYRDVRFVVPFLIQIWMFLTPIIYPPALIPDRYRWMLWLNPMSGVIDGFRSAFLGRPFQLTSLMFSFVAGLIMFGVGVTVFQRVEEKFADVI